jgi:hypothetical protein
MPGLPAVAGLLAAGEGRLLTELVDVAINLATLEATGSREGTVSNSTVLYQRWRSIRFLHPYLCPMANGDEQNHGRVKAKQKPLRRSLLFLV